MKTERAIELLNRISDSQFDGIHGDERREALEMAVRALVSQQTVNDSQGLVNDCISRKMAIDAFEPEHDTDWYTPQIIEVLEALPSAQPATTWLGNYCPYKCSYCGKHTDSKTPFCAWCGRRASNYD